MSQLPTTAQQEAPDGEAHYPPCLYHTPEEKRLYKRLKDVYLEHYTSWDAESRKVWPYIVEHASLPKSTVGKLTNHSIARNLMQTNATWAHVVALRIIYKTQLFKSRKLMKLIRDKYPRGNFNAYVFHEDYKRPIKIDGEVKAEKTAKTSPVTAPSAHELRVGAEGPVGEASQPAPRRLNEAPNGFLSDEEDVCLTKTFATPNVIKPEPTAAANNGGREGHKMINRQNGNRANPRQRVAVPSSQDKRALPEDSEVESEANHSTACEPPPRKQKRDRPSTATNDRRTQPTSSGRGPRSQEEATGSSSRAEEDRDQIDRFIEALTVFGEAISEHNKAVHRNSELLERLTEQMQKRNSTG